MQVSLLLSPRAGISAKGRDMGEHLKAASSFLTKIKPPLPQAGPRALPAPSWGVGGGPREDAAVQPPAVHEKFFQHSAACKDSHVPPSQLSLSPLLPCLRAGLSDTLQGGRGGMAAASALTGKAA